MPEPLDKGDPHLQLAAARLKRTMRVWAALFAGVAVITLIAFRAQDPLLALPWIVPALLLAPGQQPAFLALAAVQWGLSLINLLPNLQSTIGPDPLALMTNSGMIETLALIIVRVLLMITAWNQFLFYRMLYGTASATGLEADALAIPEVVPNRTDGIARAAQLFGYLTVLLVLMAIALRDSPLDRSLLGVAFTTTSLAVGLGLGAAFSPTLRRGEALRGVAVGAVGFLMALLSGRVL